MSTIITIKGPVYASNALVGTNVGNANVVKVIAGTTGDLILNTASGAEEIGRLCMVTNETVYIRKNQTDELITSDAATSWKFCGVSLTG
jgi:hypothetical protein